MDKKHIAVRYEAALYKATVIVIKNCEKIIKEKNMRFTLEEYRMLKNQWTGRINFGLLVKGIKNTYLAEIGPSGLKRFWIPSVNKRGKIIQKGKVLSPEQLKGSTELVCLLETINIYARKTFLKVVNKFFYQVEGKKVITGIGVMRYKKSVTRTFYML